MKTFIVLFSLLLIDFESYSQLNSASQWTWVDGSNQVNQPGTYGIQGVPDVNNLPGSRNASANWTDNNGNMWLFGGQGSGVLNYYNDLWKYDPTFNTWTWMNGNNVSNKKGVYGVQGVAAATNTPGSRFATASWKDASGNFWIYGGNGYSSLGGGLLSDLWKYNPVSNMWTWVQGSNLSNKSAVYGTKGLASSTNSPGSRYNACTWVDLNGNFWLFGGWTISGYANDLWKFDPVSNNWTWISGNNTSNTIGNYGTQGVPSALNYPGSRSGMVSWTDINGKFWMFGGLSNNGRFNDLWMYDPATNFWTWVNGSSSTDLRGIYGFQGIPSSTTIPGARNGMNGWMDSKGNLWLFGGNGYDASNSLGYLNDIWKYDVSLQQWTWIQGSNIKNQASNYGIAGSTSPTDTLGSRSFTSMWIDSGNYWFFGGNVNNNMMNDLWTVPIAFTLSVSLISFDAELIEKKARLTWVTNDEHDADHFEIFKSTDGVYFQSAGIVNSKGQSNSVSRYIFEEERLLNGFNYFKLKIVNKDGSFRFTDIRKINYQPSQITIHIKGNPIHSDISLDIHSGIQQMVSIILTDAIGREIKQIAQNLNSGNNAITINSGELSNGCYFLGIAGQKDFIKILKL